MAKYYGNAVKTGKLGGSVFTIRFGETIERQYQPIVRNPSTPNQVAARAKLKLMSQLSAVLGPYIAIPRKGTISGRNLFVKKNYGLADFEDETASINVAEVQLTSSVIGLPRLVVEASSGNMSACLEPTSSALDVDRVVYVFVESGRDNKLRVIGSSIATSAGENNRWPVVIAATGTSTFVLAYGVRDNNEAARAIFGNLENVSPADIAQLIVNRTLTEDDVTLTETRGFHYVPSSPQGAKNENEETEEEKTTKRK